MPPTPTGFEWRRVPTMPTVPVNEAASPNGTPGPGAYSPQYNLLSHSVGARNFDTYAPRESPAVWTSPPATPELSQTKGRRREAVVPDPGSNRRLRILPAAERFRVSRAAHLAASREPIGNGPGPAHYSPSRGVGSTRPIPCAPPGTTGPHGGGGRRRGHESRRCALPVPALPQVGR